MIEKAVFVSVWDEGSKDCCHIATTCNVNMKTKEVFGIDTVDVVGVDQLDREYIVIDDKEYPVSHIDDKDNETEFWYR